MESAKPLGLVAKRRKAPDGEPVVTGIGRGLKGRMVVTDPERARILFPPPSEETIRQIKELESRARRVTGEMPADWIRDGR